MLGATRGSGIRCPPQHFPQTWKDNDAFNEGRTCGRGARPRSLARRLWPERRRPELERRGLCRPCGHGRRQGRRDPPRDRELGPLGGLRQAAAHAGDAGRGAAGRHPERPGRRAEVRHARGRHDHEPGEGACHRLDQQRVGCRRRCEGQGSGHPGHRLRPPQPRWHERLLRLVRQREGRRAAGPGPVRRAEGQARRPGDRDRGRPDGQQRHALPQRAGEHPQAALRLRQAQAGGEPAGPQLGQPAGRRHLRAAADQERRQGRRCRRGQRRPRGRDHHRAAEERPQRQGRRSPARTPPRTACRRSCAATST